MAIPIITITHASQFAFELPNLDPDAKHYAEDKKHEDDPQDKMMVPPMPAPPMMVAVMLVIMFVVFFFVSFVHSFRFPFCMKYSIKKQKPVGDAGFSDICFSIYNYLITHFCPIIKSLGRALT